MTMWSCVTMARSSAKTDAPCGRALKRDWEMGHIPLDELINWTDWHTP